MPDVKVELVAVIVSFTPTKPRFSISATTTTEFEVTGTVDASSVVVDALSVVVVTVVHIVLLPQLESIIASRG